MGSTYSTEPTGDEPHSRIDRLRHWLTTVSPLVLDISSYGRVLTTAYILLFAVNLTGLAAAQAGSELCGSSIVTAANNIAPLVLAVIVFGGLILAYLLHGYSGFKKDPQKAKDVKDWRNRAGITAASAPLVAKFLEIVVGLLGFGLAGCLDLTPGF